jgi:predicted permease
VPMSGITSFLRRIVANIRRSRLDDELREEMAQHVAWRAESLIADGVPEADARRRASVEVGNVSRLREEARAVWGFPSIDSVVQDVRYSFREIRRAPVVATVAVASLSVAIGAGSGVFALTRAALYRDAGILHPDEVLMLRWEGRDASFFNSLNGSSSQGGGVNSSTSFSYPTFQRLVEALGSRDADVAGFADMYQANLSLQGQARMVNGQFVSGSYFSMLGTRPHLGRLLQPSDEEPTAEGIVLSYQFWKERFGGSPQAVGAPVQINGVAFTVVGVADPRFRGSLDAGTMPDVFVPFGARDRVAHDDEHRADRNYWWVVVLARPRAGVAPETVRAKAEAIFRADVRAARAALPETSLPSIKLDPGAYGQSYARDGLRQPLRMLLMAIAALLVIACTNVAGLQLARAAAREREMAVRLAMGAGRVRLLRQVVTENVVLTLAGGLGGLLLAHAMARALLPALDMDADAALDLGVDGRIALFALGTALTSGILLGLAPAWRASGARSSIVAAGSLTGRGSTERPRLRLGRALLVCQMGLSLALVFAALLFVQSLRRLESVSTGFETRNLIMFRVNPVLSGYPPDRVSQYWLAGLEAVRGTAGVTDAAVTTHPLIANSASTSEAYYRRPDGTDSTELTWRMSVSGNFFSTMGIAILTGRGIEASDASAGIRAAVVNQTMARRLFDEPQPIGRQFRLSARPGAPLYQVVGVAADARYSNLKRPQPSVAYLSLQENPSGGSITYYARTASAAPETGAALEEAMHRVDGSLPVFAMRTQEEQIARYLTRDRFFATLGMLLGGAAVLLACIGLYGLLSYAVTRRTTELGVRLALGASPGRLASSIVTESLLVAAAGTALGLPAAYALGRAAATSLFGVSATSPALLAAAAIVLLVVSASAALAPARRASRVDPLVALRAD